ncbi:hypothetical protein [uncultured Cohaesibacter sp.]|uniref:hypothetical protein n=1 Tax=uncultured Cohaesibacter sp. TaxID=1002546 RepID=UPI0029C8E9E4|nr:hypothetical protein [uncultured Cohaesibacter sp.]
MAKVNVTFGPRSAYGDLLLVENSVSETIDLSDGEAHGASEIISGREFVRILSDEDVAIAGDAETLDNTANGVLVKADSPEYFKLGIGHQLFIKLVG